jgi:hypothetical protein
LRARPKKAKLGAETPKLNIRSVEEKSAKELRNNEGCDGWDRSTIIVDGDVSAIRRELVARHPNTHQMNSNSDRKRPERITRIKSGEIVGNMLRTPPKIEIGLLGTFRELSRPPKPADPLMFCGTCLFLVENAFSS